ncbi:hypothetical protein [Myxosarcina sp. GI1]|uniref:hypothetical protein n=1 Tax=Myxosarcina sp. GI1 TaxID=1541065 RepID=UPI00068CE189|nr:hypothetical protein [Myxosarcina sp. GI1]
MVNFKKSSEKIIESPLTQKSRFGWLPLVVILLLGLNLIKTFSNGKAISNLAQNKSNIYVQKLDGEVAVANSVERLARTETVIREYVKEWLILAYTWNLKEPNLFVSEGRIDYPLPLYWATMAIIPGEREAYLEWVSRRYEERFTFQNYIVGKEQSYVRVFREPVVEKVAEGVWDVTIIAYRTHARRNEILAQEKFNHLIRVRVIDPETEISNAENNPLQKIMGEMQNKGLQIIDINII